MKVSKFASFRSAALLLCLLGLKDKELYIIVWYLLGNSTASEFYMRTFRNILFILHTPTCLWRWNRQNVPNRRHINFRRRGITQKKSYNIQNTAKVWNQEAIQYFSCVNISFKICTLGQIVLRGGADGWGTALQARSSRIRFPVGSLGIFIELILPAAPRPWSRLSLWSKDGRCLELTTLPPYHRILEP